MAGPEVPQHGPLNIGYNYTPSKYDPISIAVPTGAGELWAKVGDTALKAASGIREAASQVMQSPLNPAVRSQMYEAQSRANLGRDYIDMVRQNPSYFRGTVSEGPGGAQTVAPITQSVPQQENWGIDYSGGKTEPKKEEKKPPQKEEKAPLPSKDLNSGLSQAQPESISNALASTLVPSQGGSTAAATAGDGGMPNTGQPQDPDVVATPAQPPAPQPSSIWSPGRPAPLAPPAPGPAPAPAQPAQGQSPAAATQADQANMAKWRAQNEHPVMSSQDALGWMKNFDTGVKRATYLPMGGPGGSPAFAFHMDGGGINTVPVSQMAQKGGGPLIAAQNTSQVISSTDQAQQPNISPPPPANLPPAAPAGPQMAQANQPNISPPPPANLPPGPPAAPTGPQVAQGQPQYPNISGPPPAPVPGAYNPAPYRQGIAQAMAANPQGLMAQEQPEAGVRSTEGTAAAESHPVQTSAADVAALTEESKSPTLLPGWKVDAANNRYKELPDPQHPFWQQRFYPLKGTFETGAWGDAENMRKQAIFEEYAGTGGVPTGVDAKGNPIILDKDTIDRLTPTEQEAWIQHARDYKLHTNALLPSSTEGVNLSNARIAVQAAQRIYDKIRYMKEKDIPMSTVSNSEMIRSLEARYRGAASDLPEQGAWDLLAKGGPKNNFADELNADYQRFNEHASKVQGGSYPDAATPPQEKWDFEVPIPTTGFKLGIPPFPKTTDVSTVSALNQIGSGESPDLALGHAKEVLDNAKADYQSAASKIPTANTRLPEVARKDMVDLANKDKGYIDDENNKMWDSRHQKLNNGYGPIPHLTMDWFSKHWEKLGSPRLENWDTKELDKLGVGKGDPFEGPDGKPYTRTE